VDGGKAGIPDKTLSKMARRRKEPRHPVDNRAVIRLIDLGARIEGRIVDLSLSGCRIHTNRCFPVGVYRRVEAEFHIHGLPFRLAGVTQAIYDPLNVGIRFLDVSERMKAQLAQLIEEIKELRELERQAASRGDGNEALRD
jgi:PilZ domain